MYRQTAVSVEAPKPCGAVVSIGNSNASLSGCKCTGGRVYIPSHGYIEYIYGGGGGVIK